MSHAHANSPYTRITGVLHECFALSRYGEASPHWPSRKGSRAPVYEDEQGIRRVRHGRLRVSHASTDRITIVPSYTIATANNTIGSPEGTQPTTTWHHVLSFNPSSNTYLRTLKKGALVFAEANFELRQPDPNAEPDSPEGQRQIFLRHGASISDVVAICSLFPRRKHTCAAQPVQARRGGRRRVTNDTPSLPCSPTDYVYTTPPTPL